MDERLPERFRAKVRVDPETGCWEWTGARSPNGYGRVGVPGQRGWEYVHRHAYVALVGPIPAGLELDHLCRNRACCNPAHLEAVDHLENLRRSRRDECRRGHAYTPENVYEYRGMRYCKTCRRQNSRTAHERGHPEAKRFPDNADGLRRKTICINGHPFTEATTGVSNGRRYCKICHAARARRRRKDLRDA